MRVEVSREKWLHNRHTYVSLLKRENENIKKRAQQKIESNMLKIAELQKQIKEATLEK